MTRRAGRNDGSYYPGIIELGKTVTPADLRPSDIKSRGHPRRRTLTSHHLFTSLSTNFTYRTNTQIQHVWLLGSQFFSHQQEYHSKWSRHATSYITNTPSSITSTRIPSRCLPVSPLLSRLSSSPHQPRSAASRVTAAVATSPAGAPSCRTRTTHTRSQCYD